MRRDSNNIRQGDAVGFSFDTFFDRRNAMQFEVNALGARTDGQSVNERQYSADWNPVWDVATADFDGGWTMEAAIPFKSIRLPARHHAGLGVPGQTQREVEERDRVPHDGAAGLRAWEGGLLGLAVLAAGRNRGAVEIDQSRAEAVRCRRSDDRSQRSTACPADAGAEIGTSSCLNGDFGLDAKWGVSQSFVADLTYNPDFAQVEADEQQINLTRFSLFFPEKREFFLENQGIFAFGGQGRPPAAGEAAATCRLTPR